MEPADLVALVAVGAPQPVNNPVGLERIRAFLAAYQVDPDGRPPTLAERAIVENALIDFVFDEERVLHPTDLGTVTALDALRRLAGSDTSAAGMLAVEQAKQHIIDLAGRLDRREDANVIMREHLVMLSEENRQLKARCDPGLVASASHPQETPS